MSPSGPDLSPSGPPAAAGPGAGAGTHFHFHAPVHQPAIHTGTGSQTGTLGARPTAEPHTHEQAMAQLRQDVLALQDQLINNHKMQLEAGEQRERIIEDLQRIIAAIASRPPEQGFSMQALKQATTQAILDLENQRAIASRGLRRLAQSGVSQSLLASVILEAVKFLAPA